MRILLAAILAASTAGADNSRWWAHIETLASEKMEGRNTGSPSHLRAAKYVAKEFASAGLKAAGTKGFLQPVGFTTRRIVESESSAALVRDGKATQLELGRDFVIGMRVDPAANVEAALVFVGYGLAVPEARHDDFAGQDLKGKIVVYFTGGPAEIVGPLRSHYGSAVERGKVLRQAGALGTIVIASNADTPWERSSAARLQLAMSLASDTDEQSVRFSGAINPARADLFFAGSGHTAADLLALAKAGKPLPHFALLPQLRAKVKVERGAVESQNVVGVLRGSDPALKDEYVVLSAHLDHLGIAEAVKGDSLYNGAMDDASGVASLIEIARALHTAKEPPKRSVLFVVVTAEEKGLLGSKHFAAHPTVPAKSIVADLNIDMFLPLFPFKMLTLLGGKESDLGAVVRQVAQAGGVEVQDDQEPERALFTRSDQYSFIRRGIPALAFKVGYTKGSPEEKVAKAWLAERYHAPSDDLRQPVDLECAAQFNALLTKIAAAVANRAERPRWLAESFFRRFAE